MASGGLNLQKLLEEEAALDTSSDEEHSQAGSDRDAAEAASDGEEEGEEEVEEDSKKGSSESASDSDSDSEEEEEEAAPAEGESEIEPEPEAAAEVKEEEEEGRTANNVSHKPASSSRVLEPPKAKRAKMTTPDAAEKRTTKEHKGRENRTRTGGEPASKASVHVDLLPQSRPRPTLSVAVTSEMLSGYEGEAKVHVVGRLARTLVALSVDEVVVIGSGMDAAYMLKMLQYLECPPYLRDHFYSKHKDLELAETLYYLDLPHHHVIPGVPFAEGVAVEIQEGTHVELSDGRHCVLKEKLSPGVRVTVRLAQGAPHRSRAPLPAQAVAPTEPRQAMGIYWGFTVRRAKTREAVASGSPWQEAFDVVLDATLKKTEATGTEAHEEMRHILLNLT